MKSMTETACNVNIKTSKPIDIAESKLKIFYVQNDLQNYWSFLMNARQNDMINI
ncbi:hypothetical protein QA601_06895 [Chitinispirillales bacterium ANBcel5]|uniref:hypothetical protein n=1 Tax=Cellulosispirillum alkaliphilum TaxID=3039283 RepID=UPI002A50702A|nr:hypothetical protein [Chitinispirillales bacterium ANBcel5]